jgi:glycosyltransferase involved in cell wall biosynthesis
MLKEAVESVRAQGYPCVEHLIVDGGSTDGTGDWVAAQVDLTLLPGPDRGVYDAMNKGISAARGEIIGLLNSDDFYEPGAFAAVASAFCAHPELRLSPAARGSSRTTLRSSAMRRMPISFRTYAVFWWATAYPTRASFDPTSSIASARSVSNTA